MGLIQPFPGTREERLEWLRLIKGPRVISDWEHFSDEELERRFREAYTEYLRLEEAAEELWL